MRKLSIATVGDLLYHFPRGYLDRRDLRPISSLEPSAGAVVVKGEITRVRFYRPSRRLNITEFTVCDGTASLKAVWYNQPYLRKNLPKGTKIILSGAIADRHGIQMQNPDIEVLSASEQDFLHTMRLVPIYSLTEGISQKQLRRLIHAALEEFNDVIPENLPKPIIEAWQLVSRREALWGMHFPHTNEENRVARRRIALEEFLALQLCLQASISGGPQTGIAHTADPHHTALLDSNIPFKLTRTQKKAVEGIFRRMESTRQMNVLLQGDVGSGKTVVAAYAMLKAVENGRQAVLMAPTELLAEQHLSSLRELLKGVGAKIALLSGSRPALEKRETLRLLSSREPCIVVGTHSLVEQKANLPNLGLAVIDEQHRFGVNQRGALRQKGVNPDLIVMTATPIPRTLAIALYGNFEIIVLDECPPGRQSVETRLVSESERNRMYEFVRKHLAQGRQAFVVCPEIGERGEDDLETREIAGAARMHAHYSRIFSEFSTGLLHGRMQPEERERTISRFRKNEYQILVATTIIEVGVDVRNAAVMMIENADKFGLAQLHQLRGRVGRGQHKSYCFLLGEQSTEQAVKRLEIMISTNDGFQIAEQDMLLRGPGEFLGTAQSGIPKLRVAHLGRDIELLEQAREMALAILRADPRLEKPANEPLRFLLGQPQAVHL